MHTGVKGSGPKGLPDVPRSEAGFQNKDEDRINYFILEIFKWREKVEKSAKGLAENIQHSIVHAGQARDFAKVRCANDAIRMADFVLSVQPDNPMAKDLRKDAEHSYDRALTNFRHYLSGPLHKEFLNKSFVYKGEPKLGKEKREDILTTITPLEKATIIGYFSATINAGGGMPTLMWEIWEDGKVKDSYRQPMFFWERTRKKDGDRATIEFPLFPDPKSLKYKSHLAYIPHLNLVKWMLNQMPGEYDVRWRWGAQNPMASGRVRVKITRENREKLEAYYQSLLAAKIDAVTFPGAKHCPDRRKAVTNASELSKYGRLLKLTTKKAGNIMKPFPHDHEVAFNTATGYGAFEKDGKVELIPLDFRKSPNARKWNWHSVGKTPDDFELSGSGMNIRPEIVNYGYEIRKKNVKKCAAWH